MKKRMALCFIALCTLSIRADALSVKEYRTYKRAGGHRWQEIKLYIDGVGEGFSWASVQLATLRRSPFFCPPENLLLRTDNYMDAIESDLAADVWQGDEPIELVLLQGLQKTFPCNK
jgi:hypothetical protein